MKEIKNTVNHVGHRERLKTQFRRGGTDVLDEYRILELILFYAIPQKDTNDLAHRLIDRFGNLAGVFDAFYDELLTVEGVGENAATLIKLIPASAAYYLTHPSKNAKIFSTSGAIGKYLVNLYVGVPTETVYLMLLNNKYELIDTVKIHEGSVNSVNVSTRVLLEHALTKHASMAVLAHNHPGGVPIPSSDDVSTSCVVKEAFDLIGIPLLEHFVVAGNDYSPILIKCKSILRSTTALPTNFYEEK